MSSIDNPFENEIVRVRNEYMDKKKETLIFSDQLKAAMCLTEDSVVEAEILGVSWLVGSGRSWRIVPRREYILGEYRYFLQAYEVTFSGFDFATSNDTLGCRYGPPSLDQQKEICSLIADRF